MPFQKRNQIQLTVLSVALVLIMLLYTGRMYSLQVRAGKSENGIISGTKTLTAVLKAPRGEILDCYGRKIAVNRDGYNIVFNKAYVKSDMNDVILSLIGMLSESNVKWTDDLPLETAAPYNFIADGKTDKLISKLGLAHYATAEKCFV